MVWIGIPGGVVEQIMQGFVLEKIPVPEVQHDQRRVNKGPASERDAGRVFAEQLPVEDFIKDDKRRHGRVESGALQKLGELPLVVFDGRELGGLDIVRAGPQFHPALALGVELKAEAVVVVGVNISAAATYKQQDCEQGNYSHSLSI